MNYLIVDKLIKNALIEDINYGDVTTDNLLLGSEVSKGRFIAKEPGVIAGIDVAKRVFEIVDSSIRFNIKVKDSSKVEKGDVIVELEGNSKSILKGERVALNILQRMCGIATKTNKMVDLVKDYDVKIVDTRKTLPGFRILDKYSVTVGGGYNHRLNLSDFVMIKDNHIRAVGSITEAVKRIKNKIGRLIILTEIAKKNLYDETVNNNGDAVDGVYVNRTFGALVMNESGKVLQDIKLPKGRLTSGSFTSDYILSPDGSKAAYVERNMDKSHRATLDDKDLDISIKVIDTKTGDTKEIVKASSLKNKNEENNYITVRIKDKDGNFKEKKIKRGPGILNISWDSTSTALSFTDGSSSDPFNKGNINTYVVTFDK